MRITGFTWLGRARSPPPSGGAVGEPLVTTTEEIVVCNFNHPGSHDPAFAARLGAYRSRDPALQGFEREWVAGARAVPSRQVAVERLRLLGVLWGGGSEVTAVRSPRPARGRPHGFDDDTATRRLRGGSASAVHLLRVQRGSGGAERVVLRRYVRPELNQEEPDIAEREARALRFVADLDLGAGVATPRLLALDATGAHAGVPALLMSRLPGRVDWAPADADRWLERLARLLPAIHGGPLPPPGLIRPFAPYRQESYESPGWARWPSIWARAIERFHQPTPDGAGPAVFIHRDFHPGNVLWRRGSVTGVVDWASASIGPACVDVGHCRGNLFQYGLEVADRFTAIWERLTGASYHPWADVVTIVGSLDDLRDEPPPHRERVLVEDALARAVAELGRDP